MMNCMRCGKEMQKYTNTPIESKYKITSTGEIKRTTAYD